MLQNLTFKKLLLLTTVITLLTGFITSRMSLIFSVEMGKGWPLPFWISAYIDDVGGNIDKSNYPNPTYFFIDYLLWLIILVVISVIIKLLSIEIKKFK